jgi:hypothetical protein
MTKILHIPSGQILTFRVKNTEIRTTEYEKSVYVTYNTFTNYSRKFLPLTNAYQFVLSMCNKENLDRHIHFKEKFKIDKECNIEEFEIIP